MLTTASKQSAANGRARESTRIGNTRSVTPASVNRARRSVGSSHRPAAETWTLNCRARKTDEVSRPQPGSSTRLPGCGGIASATHSAIPSALAPPVPTSARLGLSAEVRGKRSPVEVISSAPCADARRCPPEWRAGGVKFRPHLDRQEIRKMP